MGESTRPGPASVRWRQRGLARGRPDARQTRRSEAGAEPARQPLGKHPGGVEATLAEPALTLTQVREYLLENPAPSTS